MITRTCPRCTATFTVPFPSSRKTYCSRSCGATAWAERRTGELNPNWRGGKTLHPLYDIYLDMVGRCERPTHHAFERYGARGITVCDRWRNDFWAFVADVGPRPEGKTTSGQAAFTIDRVDNDGNYEPGNVRWATYSEQSRNRRASAYAGSAHDPATGQFLPAGAQS